MKFQVSGFRFQVSSSKSVYLVLRKALRGNDFRPKIKTSYTFQTSMSYVFCLKSYVLCPASHFPRKFRKFVGLINGSRWRSNFEGISDKDSTADVRGKIWLIQLDRFSELARLLSSQDWT